MSTPRICDKHLNPERPWEAIFSEDTDGWSTGTMSQRKIVDGRAKLVEMEIDVCGPCNGIGEYPAGMTSRKKTLEIPADVDRELYTEFLESRNVITGTVET